MVKRERGVYRLGSLETGREVGADGDVQAIEYLSHVADRNTAHAACQPELFNF